MGCPRGGRRQTAVANAILTDLQSDGNGTWDLVQSRAANKANEITAINNTTGTAWVTPGYDKAGNMIGIPNPTISSTATYDAWNRLISVTDASTSITMTTMLEAFSGEGMQFFLGPKYV